MKPEENNIMTQITLALPEALVADLILEAEKRNYGHGMDALQELINKSIHSYLGERVGKYEIERIKKTK